ncbi:MAG: aminotransferase class I/II-fold pyridoxal phosphate-dependent enzyme, partial [Gemmatales bacterium]|nr:aminotransferase class I/II-fold pyridoxal phosphate-dependent enzyme [Gemmatales bacterium]MDW8386712.1 aminotransferase class I/II-fold pyridoxal phosphate-dependent enzyme [Gemmatales bacterium]
IAQRVLHLTDYLCQRLGELGWDVYSSRLHEEASGIVSVEVHGADVRELVRKCRAHGIVVNQRSGRLRISPHCYNTEEELDRLIELMGKASAG